MEVSLLMLLLEPGNPVNSQDGTTSYQLKGLNKSRRLSQARLRSP